MKPPAGHTEIPKAPVFTVRPVTDEKTGRNTAVRPRRFEGVPGTPELPMEHENPCDRASKKKGAPKRPRNGYALLTLPLLMQVVQTLIRVTTPLIRTRAGWRLGFQTCLVCLVEWLTR